MMKHKGLIGLVLLILVCGATYVNSQMQVTCPLDNTWFTWKADAKTATASPYAPGSVWTTANAPLMEGRGAVCVWMDYAASEGSTVTLTGYAYGLRGTEWVPLNVEGTGLHSFTCTSGASDAVNGTRKASRMIRIDNCGCPYVGVTVGTPASATGTVILKGGRL